MNYEYIPMALEFISKSLNFYLNFRPKVRFGDYMALTEDPESIEPKLILKRSSKDTSSMDKVVEIIKAST